MTHLNDISKIYLEKIAESAVPGKPAERLGAVTAIPKDEQEAARQRLLAKAAAKRKGMREALDPVGQEDDDIDNDGVKNDKNDKYIRNKRKAIGKAISKKKGEECDDCGKKECECDDKESVDEIYMVTPAPKTKKTTVVKNVKSDAERYGEDPAVTRERMRRKQKETASRTEELELDEIHAQAHTTHEVPSGDIKNLVKKAVKRIDTDVDGDTDNNDKAKGELGEFIPGVGNKRLFSTSKVKTAKESFSNWRQDLIEVADEAGENQIKEMPKNQTNKITINPKLSEAIENLGGTLLEEVELDEMDYIINTIYEEFVQEGYTEDDIEEAFEFVLLDEATITFGHDTPGNKSGKQSGLEGKLRYIKRKVGEKLAPMKKNAAHKIAKAQVSAYNKARELKIAAEPKFQRAKTSLKRFVKKQAQKVVDRMSEEIEQIDEVKVKKIVKPEVKERAKNIKKIRTNKETLAALMQHYKGMKSGVYNSYEPEGELVDEKARNPYAIGMAAAMDQTGDTPPLKKSTITKAHKIAKKVEANESMQGEVQVTPQQVQLQRQSAMIDKKLAAIREKQLRKQTSQNKEEK